MKIPLPFFLHVEMVMHGPTILSFRPSYKSYPKSVNCKFENLDRAAMTHPHTIVELLQSNKNVLSHFLENCHDSDFSLINLN